VFLVGFMGSGKTTVGRLLADVMCFSFVDLDERVEARAGCAIAKIFTDSGEAEFRRMERDALREALALERVVVATGGGAFTAPENRDLLAGKAVTVWLNPDFATVLRRVDAQEGAERPLFTDRKRAAELFTARAETYRLADCRVDVAPEEDPREVATRVLAAVRRESCAT
jgi:shikimate kinase